MWIVNRKRAMVTLQGMAEQRLSNVYQKNVKDEDFKQGLECTAPYNWSKYTTGCLFKNWVFPNRAVVLSFFTDKYGI